MSSIGAGRVRPSPIVSTTVASAAAAAGSTGVGSKAGASGASGAGGARRTASASGAHGKPYSRLSEEIIDKFVLSYLRSRGYTHSEEVLRQQLRADGLEELAHSMSMASHTTVVQQVLDGWAQQASRPDWYMEAYRCLHKWIDASLDKYKNELVGIMMPLFVHCYLELIMKGFPHDACAFIERFRRDHEAKYAREIHALVGLQYPEQVESNPTAKMFRSHKFDIELSSYSHQLLLSFLQESKLYLLLKIINEHINLIVKSGQPLAMSEGSRLNVNEISGLSQQQISAMNSKEVQFGLLKDVVGDALDADKMTDEMEPASKKLKALEGAAELVLESKVPLPTISSETKKRIIAGLNRTPPLSQHQLPSACCVTFLNSQEIVNCMSMSWDGSQVAAGCSDSTVKLWDLREIRKQDPLPDKPSYRRLIGHAGPVFGVDFSDEMRFLLSSSEDGTVRLWSLREKLDLVCYKGHNYPVWDVKWSPFGFYFATASHDRTARIWSTERIFPLRIFAGHLSDVDCVGFHPNCNYIITGSTDKSVRFWDLQSGECCRIFRGHEAGVRAVAISPDGRHAVSADEAGSIRLWDIGSSLQISEFRGHEDVVTSLSWSAESTVVASSSLDCSVRLWDVQRAKTARKTTKRVECHMKTYRSKSTPLCFAKFTPKNLLLTGGVFRA